MARLTIHDFTVREFYQLDKLLFLSKKYHQTLSPLAKLVYTFFYDRSSLSSTRGFIDDNGEVFFFYRIESIMEMLNCSKPKAIAVKKELLDIGLLEEVRTGRASKLYLHGLDQTGFSNEDIQQFNAPDEDETVWKEEQKEKVRKKLKNKNDKNCDNNIIIDNNKKIEDIGRSKKSLLHPKSALNQRSKKIEKRMKSILFTSEVKDIDPSNTNRVILDKNIDHVLDQETEKNKNNFFNEQFLFDLKQFYAPPILEAIVFIGQYESVEKIHYALSSALADIYRGKYVAYPEAKRYSESINRILSEVKDYYHEALALEVKQTLIRATRFIYSGKQEVADRVGYYYICIQKAILEYIQQHYELEEDEGVTDEKIPLFTLD